MMAAEPAPGLTADWLNAWLAAVGVTVLVPGVRLSWSTDVTPSARFFVSDARPLAELISERLPAPSALDASPGASLPRNVTLKAYRAAAADARAQKDNLFAPSVTDLVSGKWFRETDLPHGAFDPPAPRGTTQHSRLVSCLRLIPEGHERTAVQRTLVGEGARRSTNGLGFDIRRIPTGVIPDPKVLVDPIIECLCYFGLRLFPTRGDGRVASQRGWTSKASARGAFRWPVWSEPLDSWAIDALLDTFFLGVRRTVILTGIAGAFGSVPYKPAGSSDATRGYGSEPVNPSMRAILDNRTEDMLDPLSSRPI